MTQNSSPPIKVCHLSSVHPSSCVRIFFRECLALKANGYDVTFIVPESNDEIRQGVSVKAVKRRETRAGRFLVTTGEVLRRAVEADAEIYHFHDPDLIPVGMALRALGKKVVYDVHEDLPRAILDKEWIPGWLRKTISVGADSMEWVGGQVFSGIVGATPKIAARFPGRKTVTIQNFPIHNEWASLPILPFKDREPNLIYSGAITAARGAREMVRAMALLPVRLKARLSLLGTFVPRELMSEFEGAKGWTTVDYFPWMPRTELGTFTTRMIAGLVLFHPLSNHTNAQPNKLFEYMSAGIPLIISDFPLWRELINDTRCGLLVDPQDPVAIAKAMQFMLENRDEAEAMGRRGRAAVCDRFNWDVESQTLLELYHRLTH